MKFIKRVYLFYCLILSLFLALSSPFPTQIIFLPVVLYIGSAPLKNRVKKLSFFQNKLFLYYSFIITALIVITGFAGIKNPADLVSALIFAPLLLFFAVKVLPKKNSTLVLPEVIPLKQPVHAHKSTRPEKLKRIDTPPDFDPDFDSEKKQQEFDKNSRVFIKLIGSAGISLFVFSLFTKKAQAAFFGSVPGPGTVALKDTGGNPIDPAQKHPTDGYKISEVDDSSPAYYGFINKDGAWFIMKETSGVYRYISGGSNFSASWTGRAGLSYDYYHNIF